MPPRRRYKPQRNQRRLKPKRSLAKKVFSNRLFWYGITGLFACIGIFYGVLFSPLFRIYHIPVEGAHTVSVNEITAIAQEHLQRKLLFISLPSVVFANKDAATQQILQRFSGIESVMVDPILFHTVRIRVQERTEVAVWCQQRKYHVEVSDIGHDESVVGIIGEETARLFRECFAIDGNGIIFERKDPAGELVVEGKITDAELGDMVVEPELLETLFEFQQTMDSSELFSEVGLRIVALDVVSEKRVHAATSEGWEFYVNPAEPMLWQTTKANLVLEQEVPFEKRPLLEYIDLRFGDQAYVKYQE